jgi:hypothetical protein
VITYGDFTSSPNNDCPAPDAPTSLTLSGLQASPDGVASITLCLRHPDQLDGQTVALDDGDQILIADLAADLGDCRVRYDGSQPSTAAIRFEGVCGDGTDPAGYAVALSGSFGGTRSCEGDGGTTEEPVTVTLDGRAAVTVP